MKSKNILHSAMITVAVIVLCFHFSTAQNSFPTPNGPAELDATGAGAGSGGEVRLLELNVNGSNYVGLKAPDLITGNQVYTFPNGFPSGSGRVLSSDNSGNLTWVKRAATDLGNLGGTTAINASLLPDVSNTRDLGSAALAWRNGFFLGTVGIGTTAPNVKLHVTGGTDTELGSGGFLVLGSITGANISFDDNEIEARNNGGVTTLSLQNDGGDLSVSGGALLVTGATNIVSTSTDMNIGGDLNVLGATVSFGSVEFIQDGGSNLIVASNDFATNVDGTNSLGTSANTWFDVWATDVTINSSDARLKENIASLEYGLPEIMKMRPVSYTWIQHPDAGTKLGLLAQEVQSILPEVVRDWEYATDEQSGKTVKTPSVKLGIQYDAIIPVLIKGIQDQQNQMVEKDKKITSQQKQIDDQQSQLQQLSDRLASLESNAVAPASTEGTTRFSMTNENAKPVLGQNIPNPFDNSTLIPFRLPADCKEASLRIIETTTGSILRVIPLVCGETQISMDAAQLASGTYTYSLYADGRLIDTKQMILTK